MIRTLLALLLLAPISARAASVCIDPGHGGPDPGAVGNGLNEEDLNLSTGLHFRDWLNLDSSDNGGGGSWDVYMTRTTDTEVSLSGRCDYANALGVDVFMCIHTNAGGGDGTETYAYASGGDADVLAHRVQEEVLDHLGTNDRGVKYESFYVLVYTSMPAELNEMAFIDTASNAQLLADDANLDAVGLGNLHAIQRYMGLSAYTPTDDPGSPTASVEWADVPESVDSGADFTVSLDYATDLHEFDEVGQITVDMKDSRTWDVIGQIIWTNDGDGIQGPSGSHGFDFTAPTADSRRICFVAYLSPLGGDWDNRYADASSCAQPTEVVYDPGTEPVEPEIALVDYPATILQDEIFPVLLHHVGALPKGALSLALVETQSGRIVDNQVLTGEFGADEADHSFEMSYGGSQGAVWLSACLMDHEGGPCIAKADNEHDPIRLQDIETPVELDKNGGCGCGWGGTSGAGGLLLVLALTAARRRAASRTC